MSKSPGAIEQPVRRKFELKYQISIRSDEEVYESDEADSTSVWMM